MPLSPEQVEKAFYCALLQASRAAFPSACRKSWALATAGVQPLFLPISASSVSLRALEHGLGSPKDCPDRPSHSREMATAVGSAGRSFSMAGTGQWRCHNANTSLKKNSLFPLTSPLGYF